METASNSDIISDSDSEFWLDLDTSPKLKLPQFPTDQELTPMILSLNLDEEEKKTINDTPSMYYKERFQILIDRVRDAAKVSYQNLLDQVLKKLNREYQIKIEEINTKQFNEIMQLKKEFDRINLVLIGKDLELARLREIIAEQEVVISSQRILRIPSTPTQAPQDARVLSLEKDLKATKVRQTALKELSRMSHQQTDEAKQKLKIAQDMLKAAEIRHQEEVEKLNKESAEKEKELNDKIKEVKEKYSEFKKDVNKELEIRMVINRKQNDVISSLQKELKSIKTVMTSPRLHYKLLNKTMNEEILVKSKKAEDEPRFLKQIPRNPKRLFRNSELSMADYGESTQASPSFSKASDLDFNLPIVSLLPESPRKNY